MTHVQTALLVISCILALISTLVIPRVIKQIRVYYVKEFYILVLGLFIELMVPISIIPMLYFSTRENVMAATWQQTLLMRIGISSNLIGIFLILIGLSTHKYKRIKPRYLLLSSIISSFVSLHIYSDAINPLAEINYSIPIVIGSAYIWMGIELAFLLLTNMEKGTISLKGIVFAYPLVTIIQGFINAGIYLQGYNVYNEVYFIGLAMIGNLFFFYILMWRIDLLLNIQGSYLSRLIIIQRETGIALFQYENKGVKGVSSQLAGMAIVGVVQVIQEISGKDEIVKRLGYDDYKIFISVGDKYTALMFCTDTRDQFDSMLCNFLQEFEAKIRLEGTLITKKKIDFFNTLVERRMRIIL